MDSMTWLRTNWDRVLGWELVAGGGLLLIVGTVQVSRARLLADSLSYLMSAGLGGLACVALGSALLVTAASHDEWQKLDAIEAGLRVDSTADESVAPTEPRPLAIDMTPSRPRADAGVRLGMKGA